MNDLTIMGEIISNVYYGETNNENKISTFTIEIRNRNKEKDYSKLNCIAFCKQAETVAKKFQRGSKVVISGWLRSEEYQREDGIYGNRVYVVIENIYSTGFNDAKQYKSYLEDNPEIFREIDSKGLDGEDFNFMGSVKDKFSYIDSKEKESSCIEGFDYDDLNLIT